MSLDFIQVSQQVKQLGEKAFLHQAEQRTKLAETRELLLKYDKDIDALRGKVELIVQKHDPTLRCARPVAESLNACFPLPALPGEVTLIAADGSQIYANRHAEVDYCLVNTGAIRMRYGSGQAPETSIQSRLIYADEL